MTIHTPVDPIQGASDWFSAGVEFVKNGGTGFRTEMIDNRDPKHPLRMVNDAVSVIALKHFFILIGLPFYTVGVAAIHLLRCVTLIGANLIKGRLLNIVVSIAQEIVALVKIPFYALSIVLCSVVGILPPFSVAARSAVGQLEAGWSGSDRYHSIQRLNTEQSYAAIGDYFINHNSKATAPLAFCFQPVGELNDPTRVTRYQLIEEGESASPFAPLNPELAPLGAEATVTSNIAELEGSWWQDQGS